MERRIFLGAMAAATLVSAAPSARPRLGVVVNLEGSGGADAALQKAASFGFKTCQLGVGTAPVSTAAQIRAASLKYKIEITALMTLGKGRMVWDLREGPETIGIIPRATRAERITALKNASDMAKACGVPAVHTHCGFIPEDPNQPLYREALDAIGDVVRYCGSNGQTFLCETGQETPITLKRVIDDLKLPNIAVNLDLANLILYGKGEPLGALDVLGPHVRGVHAKDGLYPTDPYGLGKEVRIGAGRVRFPEVFRKLRELSYAGPVTIEREISGPGQVKDIKDSASFLQNLIEQEYA